MYLDRNIFPSHLFEPTPDTIADLPINSLPIRLNSYLLSGPGFLLMTSLLLCVTDPLIKHISTTSSARLSHSSRSSRSRLISWIHDRSRGQLKKYERARLAWFGRFIWRSLSRYVMHEGAMTSGIISRVKGDRSAHVPIARANCPFVIG